MVGNTVTASSSFFARSVQSLKSSSHPFHASWILGSAQKSALALTPVSRPAGRPGRLPARPWMQTVGLGGQSAGRPARAGQFGWLLPAPAREALYQISTTFSGKLAFLSHSTYFVKIRAVVKFSFQCTMGWNYIWSCIHVILCLAYAISCLNFS